MTNGAFIWENKQSIYSEVNAPCRGGFLLKSCDYYFLCSIAVGLETVTATGEFGSQVERKKFVLDTAANISGLFNLQPLWNTVYRTQVYNSYLHVPPK